MSVANDIPMKRRPTHPGEILREDFMPDYGLTVSGLADSLGVSRQTVNLAEPPTRCRPVGCSGRPKGRCTAHQAVACCLKDSLAPAAVSISLPATSPPG